MAGVVVLGRSSEGSGRWGQRLRRRGRWRGDCAGFICVLQSVGLGFGVGMPVDFSFSCETKGFLPVLEMGGGGDAGVFLKVEDREWRTMS
ncbi:hypothetical protein VTI74DRAFT_10294 [Chaetomium olivicolor]